jgi:superfamily II helicase
MAEKYRFLIETPEISCDVHTNTFSNFLCMIFEQLAKAVNSKENQTFVSNLDIKAQEALELYRSKIKRGRCRSRVAAAGLELDVIKCYLQGKTIAQILEWLKQNKQFVGSKAALGRYWRNCHTFGIEPNDNSRIL